MSFIVGLVLFALGIVLTIALHECGHMVSARACRMRVRRYFIGFGPTLFSFRRREKKTSAAAGRPLMTEYGLKAVPFGGFCDIAGMTAIDEVAPEDEPFSMVKRPVWQRLIVLLGGIMMNLLIGVIVMYFVAVAWGLPNPNVDLSAKVGSTQCVPQSASANSSSQDSSTPDCSGPGPAGKAGIRQGDTIVKVDGHDTPDFTTMGDVVQKIGRDHADDDHDPTVPVVVERNGETRTVDVTIQRVQRETTQGKTVTVGAIGMTWERPNNMYSHYNALSAIPGSLHYSGYMIGQSVVGLAKLPASVPGVVRSIGGGERSESSPMSVVGASVAGGDLVKHDQWSSFFLLLASLNFFLALFNLVPLPPLDGGHVAVTIWEKLRDMVRRLRGLAPLGPADYTKLMPLTVAVFVLLFGFGALVIVADVVNPIRLFG